MFDSSSHRPHRPLLHIALLATWCSAGAQAEPIELSFSATSATVLRGVVLGEGGVDASAAASIADTSGWRAAFGAAALHAKAAHQRWDLQLFWRLGYARRVDDDWSVQLAHTRYAYPGSALRRSYGHDELGTTLAYRDLLYLSISGLRRNRSNASNNRNSVAYDIVAHHALPAALTASAGVGYQETLGAGSAYAYGHLGLGTQWGATQAQLSYQATDAAAKRRFGTAAANRWAASLSWLF
jgi:uncharacterized protein (TIGR02001 family)